MLAAMTTGSRATRSRPTRSAPKRVSVVERVLSAAIRELARVGYGALTIETVARRARVNKTTVYRRWPSRADLVGAALSSITEPASFEAATDLRTNLLWMARESVRLLSTAEGRSIARVLIAEGEDEELVRLARSIRARQEHVAYAVVRAAKDRGELARKTQPDVFLGAIFGAIVHRMLMMHEAVDDRFIRALVDLALVGARPTVKPRRGA